MLSIVARIRQKQQMQNLFSLLLFGSIVFAQTGSEPIPNDDAVRIREFYRLASQVQDQIWPNWSSAPAPLLLVTPDREFLTHHPAPPKDFRDVGDGFYSRGRQFPTNLLATFPAFGPPSVIVIGEPRNTRSKTSSPWLITVMHEHFHQLQNAQPGYLQAVEELGLSHGDTTGMWMLNYPFPYDNPEVVRAFGDLRAVLLKTVAEPDSRKFKEMARHYLQQRKQFFSMLSADDNKYLSFQLWQEGIARYTEIKVAEAVSQYEPTPSYKSLSDFEPMSKLAARTRTDTFSELERANLAEWKREVVYSFGATEGLLLDRLNPSWKNEYFKHLLSMDLFFKVDE